MGGGGAVCFVSAPVHLLGSSERAGIGASASGGCPCRRGGDPARARAAISRWCRCLACSAARRIPTDVKVCNSTLWGVCVLVTVPAPAHPTALAHSSPPPLLSPVRVCVCASPTQLAFKFLCTNPPKQGFVCPVQRVTTALDRKTLVSCVPFLTPARPDRVLRASAFDRSPERTPPMNMPRAPLGACQAAVNHCLVSVPPLPRVAPCGAKPVSRVAAAGLTALPSFPPPFRCSALFVQPLYSTECVAGEEPLEALRRALLKLVGYPVVRVRARPSPRRVVRLGSCPGLFPGLTVVLPCVAPMGWLLMLS